MGWTLKIGNAVPSSEHGEYHWRVEYAWHENAPAFGNGDASDNINVRCPSYSAWTDFINEIGLYDLFKGNRDDALLPNYSGCVRITGDHLREIGAAYLARQRLAKEKGMTAGFGEGQDHTLARAEWLFYWTEWTYRFCENPGFEYG